MNLLLLAPYLPAPPDEGGRRRVCHLLRELRTRHAVRLIAFRRDGEPPLPADLQPATEVPFAEVARAPLHRARRFFSPLPDLAAKHRRPAFRQAVVDAIAADRPDLIWVEESPLAVNLPGAAIPVVIGEQNIESQLLPGRQWRERFEQRRLVQYETAVWRRAAGVAAATAVDETAIRFRAPQTPTVALENGLDPDYFTPRRDPNGPVLLAGTLHHPPNREAVEWFLRELWPRLRERRPATTALVAGKYTEELRGALPAGVEAAGYAADIRDVYRRAALLLVPLRRGGGSRLKILEAWGSGLPVVSTAVGAAGLRDAADCCRLADEADGLVAAAVQLLTDPGAADALAARARAHAAREYDWKKTLAPVHAFLDRVGATRVPAAR